MKFKEFDKSFINEMKQKVKDSIDTYAYLAYQKAYTGSQYVTIRSDYNKVKIRISNHPKDHNDADINLCFDDGKKKIKETVKETVNKFIE